MSFSSKIHSYLSRKDMTLGMLLSELKEDAYAIIFILLSLPSALPIPAPGYSFPFGFILLLFAFQMLLGHDSPWTPKWASKMNIGLDDTGKIYRMTHGFLAFFEKYIHVRFLSLQKLIRIPVILTIILCGISMMIIIPGTNTIPAFGIFLLGVGILEKDGLFLIAGLLASLVGLTVTTLVIIFGVEILSYLF